MEMVPRMTEGPIYLLFIYLVLFIFFGIIID